MALSVTVCAYNVPRLLTGTVQFDGLDVHYSAQRYLSDELHAGRIPFWTAYVFSGFPFMADLQVAAWYPLHWPFLALGIQPASIGAELLLHDLIAAGGAYALGLRITRRPSAAAATGMFYAFSGWFAAHSQHVGMYATAAWLPWVVLLLELCAEQLSPARLAVAGLLGAAVALPGSFQLALYAFSGVGVWATLEAVTRRSASAARRFAVCLASVAVWGGLLSAVMILPGLELLMASVRTQLNARDVGIGYFQPGALLTLLYPDYFGLLSGHYSGPGDSTQHYFYAGILLVPLAALGLRHRLALRMAAFLGLPFVWYAIGPAGGLFSVLSRLPGFNSVELPMHGWFLPALGLALVGGAGLAVVEGRLGPRWSAVLLVVMLIDVLTFNQLLNPLAYARGSFDELYSTAQQAFTNELASVRRLYGPPLAAIGYRNHGLQSRVETTYGYNPLELAAYAEYADLAEANLPLRAGLAATHRLVSSGVAAIEPDPEALALAYFARAVRAVPDAATARAELSDLDPAESTLVIGPPPTIQADVAASVDVVNRTQDSLTLHYASSTSNLVRLALPAYPGWRATLNGLDLPMLTVDYAFIGVLVPAGEGDVQLAYTPRWFALGAAISALAVLAVGAAFVRRTRPATSQPSP